MPGPIALQNNLPPRVNQPGVDNTGGVGNIQPGVNTQPTIAPQNADVQPLQWQELSRASDIAGQLDILLLKAVKSSASGEIDSNAVYKAAKAAKLPKAVRLEARQQSRSSPRQSAERPGGAIFRARQRPRQGKERRDAGGA